MRLYLWWKKKAVPRVKATFLRGQVVYGDSQIYLSVTVDGKERKIALSPSDLASLNVGKFAPVSAIREMAMPGSRFYPVKGATGTVKGIVSFRAKDGTILGMGCRLKYRNSTVLATAAHVLDALRSDPEPLLEHAGKVVPFVVKSYKTLLYSSENSRDVCLIELPTTLWSSLGVKALRSSFKDVKTSVSAFGFNDIGEFVVSYGIMEPNQAKAFEFKHRASTLAGWSGTPLFDVNMNVIGIHSGYLPETKQNFGAALFWLAARRETGDRHGKGAWRARDHGFDANDEANEFYYYEYDENGQGYHANKVKYNSREFYTESEVKPGSGDWATDFEEMDYDEVPVFESGCDEVKLPRSIVTAMKALEESSRSVSPVEAIPRPPTSLDVAKIVESAVAKALAIQRQSFQTGDKQPSMSPQKQKAPLQAGSLVSSDGKNRKRRRPGKRGKRAQTPGSQENSNISDRTNSDRIPSPLPNPPSTSPVSRPLESTQKVLQSGVSPTAPLTRNGNPWLSTSHALELLTHLVRKLSPEQLNVYVETTHDLSYRSLVAGLRTPQLWMLNICIVYWIMSSYGKFSRSQILASLGSALDELNHRFVWSNETFYIMPVLSELEPFAPGMRDVIAPLPPSYFEEVWSIQ